MTISVVIPTYNRRQLLGAAIRSVLVQEGVDVEVLVVDDASTDGTRDYLATEFSGCPVTVFPNARRKGPAGARNTGLLAAGGDVIAFLDSDDSFLPGHLAACQRAFLALPDVDVLFGRALYVQDGQQVDYMSPNFERKLEQAPRSEVADDWTVFSREFFSHLLEYGCYFNLSTVAIRAPARSELMNEELRVAEDYEYWVRLSRKHRFACLHRPQISYSLHDANISFEADRSAEQNAPWQLAAYEAILSYPRLSPEQVRVVNGHMADVLFAWGYRCRQRGEIADAVRLHVRSFRVGMRVANLLALLKTALFAVKGRLG